MSTSVNTYEPGRHLPVDYFDQLCQDLMDDYRRANIGTTRPQRPDLITGVHPRIFNEWIQTFKLVCKRLYDLSGLEIADYTDNEVVFRNPISGFVCHYRPQTSAEKADGGWSNTISYARARGAA